MEHQHHNIQINSKEEAIALLHHMVHHNEDHVEELKQLLKYMQENNYDQNTIDLFNDAINELVRGNKSLHLVFETISEK